MNYNSGGMTGACSTTQENDAATTNAITLMVMLGHKQRIEIWRTLLPHQSGLTAGALAAQLRMASSSLSFHLKQMQKAGLLSLRYDSRFTIYSVNVDSIAVLCSFLASLKDHNNILSE